uniref:Peptidase_M13_N domain-containing protein n=1 Tax=Panagrellus redivivus TaxID=6233 RepID=A0A7E4WD70_PANRE
MPEPEGRVECLVMTTVLFDAPLTQMYVKEHFNYDDIVPKVSEMTNLIAEVLKESIKQASWMDENTKSAALKKLAHLNMVEIGVYPQGRIKWGGAFGSLAILIRSNT